MGTFSPKIMRLSDNFDDSHYKLGVIFPFRYSEDRPDAFERIYRVFNEWQNKEQIKFYIVDSGSPTKYAKKLEEICNEYGVNYVYLDTSYEVFSAGKARDTGAIIANTDYLFFQDIDLIGYDGFYQDLLIEIEARELDKKSEDFLMIPAIYLTEEGSKLFLETDPTIRKSRFLQYVYEGNNEIYANLAIGSSALLVNRMHYLTMGGHDEDFFGHGFEDFEFIHRLASVNNYFIRPYDYYTDPRNWGTVEYNGFRSMFRLFGDFAQIKGIVLFHIYHSNNKKSKYVSSNSDNKKLLTDKMKKYDETKELPAVLPDIYAGRTLALGKENSGFYKSIRQVLPQFGEIFYKDEKDFIDEQEFIDYIETYEIDRILMPNPYGNPKRLSLYKACRNNDIPYVVQDRGALTDAVFFDNNGFNADSSSYDESKWNHPLSDEELEEVENYIFKQYFDERSLEKQGQRIGGSNLAKVLNIKPNEKVLFVPLQRPNDTVIRYFSGAVGSVREFIVFVEKLKQILGEEWRILLKNHPLETVRPATDLEFVDDNVHIKDLIEVCDAVLLINSGVGVESMMWYKPVLHVGEAFYSFEGINKHVKTPEEAADVLNNLFEVDREKVKRFIHYLIKKFYSFGKARTEIVKQPDGSLFNATRSIDFYQINIPSQPTRFYANRDSVQVPKNAPIFDRFKKFFQEFNEKKSELKKKTEKKEAASKTEDKQKVQNVKPADKTAQAKKEVEVKKVESVKKEEQTKKEKSNNINNQKTKPSTKQVTKTKENESKVRWFGRQMKKLITNPSEFMLHFKRWRKKRKKAKVKNN